MAKKPTAEEKARAILAFTSKVPDFISNAVMLAIEGAAIAHNLPRPFMRPEDTDETEAPKVAAILEAAGEMFSLTDALRATGHIPATGAQHTPIPMQPIDDITAWEIADEFTNIGVDDDDRKKLITLICGIAAIENPVRRQEVAADAVRAIFHHLDGFTEEVGGFVARLYAEGEARQEGGIS